MLRTYIYLPEELDQKLIHTAKIKKTNKATVIREALNQGLKIIQGNNNASVQAFFEIAQIGKRFKVKGPKDSSQTIDELLWEKNWK